VLYEARAADGFSAATVQTLKAGTVDGVLFFSPRTAQCFVDLVRQGGLAGACGRIIAFCLSPAVAGKANALTWREICVAAHPDQAALLAAVLSRRGGARGPSR
jgi:uroporphyrinogen-III synthase